MPRIAFLTSTFPEYKKCGTGIYAAYLTKALSEQGHEVHVVTSAIPEIKASFGRIEIHKVMQTWNPTDLPRLFQALALIKPDIIHINHPTSIAAQKSKILVNLIPEIMRNTTGIPVVTTLHEFNKVSLLGKAKLLPMALSSTAVTVTNDRYDFALKKILPNRFHNKIHIVNIGTMFNENLPIADPNAERQKWDLNPSDKIIGFLGFLTPPKGFHNLVDACIPLLKENPHYKVFAISSWNMSNPSYRQSILDKIEKNGLQSQFIFTGYLSDEEMWNALSAVDVCVFPFEYSVEDRSSGPLRQALFHGRPTIVYADSLDYTEFGFKHGENVWFTKLGDVKQLQADIIRLLENEPLRKTLSEGAKGLRKVFSFDTVSNDFSRLYSKLLNRNYLT